MHNNYAIANKAHQYEVDYWRKKKEKSFDDLDEADTCICRLEARVVKLEDQLKDAHDYDNRCNGKHTHYSGIQCGR